MRTPTRLVAASTMCLALAACGDSSQEVTPDNSRSVNAPDEPATSEQIGNSESPASAVETQDESQDESLLDYYTDIGTAAKPCASEVTISGGAEGSWSSEGVVMSDFTTVHPLRYESAPSRTGLLVMMSKYDDGSASGYYVEVATRLLGDVRWVTGGEPLPDTSTFESFDESGSGASIVDFTVPASPMWPDESDLQVTASWSC